jgi:hypothetical protein
VTFSDILNSLRVKGQIGCLVCVLLLLLLLVVVLFAMQQHVCFYSKTEPTHA